MPVFCHKAPGDQIYLTPESILDRYKGWYDPAPHHRPPDFDGLSVEWGQRSFVNPPWGNLSPWINSVLYLPAGASPFSIEHRFGEHVAE